ncbi:MAG: hypothetical protein JW748_13225 [Anaerolineales bacterium]|nr:hypothetical protein [Anaerolineales bacterium]
MQKHILPTLSLFLLAPVIGELVSGSAPPSEWQALTTWLFLVPLYGAGAVLARELAVRWKSGWLGVLLLGAAYGILEEGIDVMSFFNTAWPDLGAAAAYGRWADVSWVWTVHLTVYHAAFSIAIPILLVHLIFPKSRGEAWLGCFGWACIAGLLGASVVGGNLFFRAAFTYSPPPLPYLGSVLAIAVLIFFARRAHPSAPVPALQEKPLPHPVFYGLAGFGATVAFFYSGWALPETNFPPVLTILIVLAVAAGIFLLLAASYRRGRQFTDTRKLALAFGGLMFFILFAPITEASAVNGKTGVSAAAGMTCVGIITLLAMVLLSAAVWRGERQAAKARLSDTFERN